MSQANTFGTVTAADFDRLHKLLPEYNTEQYIEYVSPAEYKRRYEKFVGDPYPEPPKPFHPAIRKLLGVNPQ